MSKILPGLYPWLRFREGENAEKWAESHGIDLNYVDEKAAQAYLKSEAEFFEDFDNDYGSTLVKQRAFPVKQRVLEDYRDKFLNAAANLCGSPIEQLLLAGLLWAGYGYRRGPVEIWDTTMPFGKPGADVVVAPQYQIESIAWILPYSSTASRMKRSRLWWSAMVTIFTRRPKNKLPAIRAETAICKLLGGRC